MKRTSLLFALLLASGSAFALSGCVTTENPDGSLSYSIPLLSTEPHPKPPGPFGVLGDMIGNNLLGIGGVGSLGVGAKLLRDVSVEKGKSAGWDEHAAHVAPPAA